jgi:hypothetical protein
VHAGLQGHTLASLTESHPDNTRLAQYQGQVASARQGGGGVGGDWRSKSSMSGIYKQIRAL